MLKKTCASWGFGEVEGGVSFGFLVVSFELNVGFGVCSAVIGGIVDIS